MNFLAGRFFGSSGILRRAHLVVLASNGPGLDPVLRLLVVAFPVRVVARKVRCLLQIVSDRRLHAHPAQQKSVDRSGERWPPATMRSRLFGQHRESGLALCAN
jgi:hypothetical protein